MSITINLKNQDGSGVDINIPTEWKDMSLSYWADLASIMKKHEQTSKAKNDYIAEKHQENDNIDSLLKDISFVDEMRLNTDIFGYITGLSKDDVMRVDVKKVTEVINTIGVLTKEYKPKGMRSFKFDGEEYFFPSENLTKSTYGEFIEATQLEMTIESMKNGRYDVLPEQMAILCRRVGEDYDEDLVAEKAEKFKDLKMDSVFEFAFFLTNQNSKLLNLFSMYSEKGVKE